MAACLEYQEDLSAYIDGQLEATRRTQIDEHIGNCGSCLTEHNGLRETVKLFALSNLAASAKCPDIWAELSAKLPPVCEVIEEDFSAYLDGELIASAKDGVSEHLQNCPPCHGKFQDLSKVNGMLSQGLQLSSAVEIDIWSSLKNRLDEDCQLIKDELSSFYDREVQAPRHRAITAHLLECSDCREQLATITQTGDLLRSSYQPEFPEAFDLWPDIKSKMNVVQFAPKEKRQLAPIGKRTYAVAAVVLGGMLAGLTLFANFNVGTANLKPVTAESYLIESALGEPADMAEAMVYENQ